MLDPRTIESRSLTIKKMLNAPRELVWEAWTHPEHIANWWGPEGMDTEVLELDFRPGGRWKYIMTAPNGMKHPAEGIFSEIVQFERIESSADFSVVTHGVILIVLFEEIEEKTQLTLQVIHPTKEYRGKQEKMGVMNGWGSTFDRLYHYLESLL